MVRKKISAKGEPAVFTAVLHKEGKWYVAHCEEIGTVSQGKTVEEAIKNLKEATELYLETASELKGAKLKISHPIVATFTVSNHAKIAGAFGA